MRPLPTLLPMRILFSTILCLACAACSTSAVDPAVIAERTREADSSYARVVSIENRMDEMGELWKEDEKRQVGQSPEDVLRLEFTRTTEAVDYLLVASLPSGTPDERERKKVFLRLVKEHGLTASLAGSTVFSKAEMEELARDEKLERTILFKKTVGAGR